MAECKFPAKIGSSDQKHFTMSFSKEVIIKAFPMCLSELIMIIWIQLVLLHGSITLFFYSASFRQSSFPLIYQTQNIDILESGMYAFMQIRLIIKLDEIQDPVFFFFCEISRNPRSSKSYIHKIYFISCKIFLLYVRYESCRSCSETLLAFFTWYLPIW